MWDRCTGGLSRDRLMSRSILFVLCLLVLLMVPPCSGQYGHEEKSALARETLLSGQALDWQAEPVTAGTAAGSGAANLPWSRPARWPGSNAPGSGNDLNFASGAPAAAPGWAYWAGPAFGRHGQGTGAPYMQSAAGALPSPGYMPYQPVFLVPQTWSSAGGAQAIFNPSYAPAVLPSYMLQQSAASGYPVIIIQQGPPAPQQAYTAPAQAQPQSQPQNQPQSQPPNAAASDQATKPGLKGFINALMGASSSMFTGGVAGNSLTLARPLLDLLLNGL